MPCSYCGNNVEDNGVVLQGHTFCNSLCRYSFEKANGALKTQSSVLIISKTDDANKTKHVDTKSPIHAAETAKKQNKAPGLQTYVNKRDKLADFESFSNNKYIKIATAILIALIGFLIYKGIENYFENKQLFRILWICICSVGFIVTAAAKKQNKKVPDDIKQQLQNETIFLCLKGASKEWLVCTDKQVYIFKKGFVTGHSLGSNNFHLLYQNVSSVQVYKHPFSGYFEISSGGMQNTSESYWSSDKNKSPQDAPNCVSLLGKEDFDKFQAACDFINGKIQALQNSTEQPNQNIENKTHGQQTSADNRRDEISNFKSIFDNNYLKLVLAILTALLLYRSITNYVEYKQTEAALKDLDKDLEKTMIQIDKNMDKFKMKWTAPPRSR
jgi:hypothetical protein